MLIGIKTSPFQYLSCTNKHLGLALVYINFFKSTAFEWRVGEIMIALGGFQVHHITWHIHMNNTKNKK